MKDQKQDYGFYSVYYVYNQTKPKVKIGNEKELSIAKNYHQTRAGRNEQNYKTSQGAPIYGKIAKKPKCP